MLKVTKTTCFKAYNTNLYVDSDGKSRLCCKQTRDSRFQLGSEEDRWDYIDEMRSYMEKGEWHPSCETCKKMEKGGNESVRQMFNKHFHKKQHTDFNDEESIKFLEINFSNLCNLSCRMCESKSSTGRIPLDKHLGRKPIELSRLDDKALSYLHDIENMKDLEMVHIFGGEPLMEKEHFRFLSFLIEHDLAKNIFLGYNSNLTIIPKFSPKEQKQYGGAKDIFDLWSHFQMVELKPSIDGFGKVDEYIRLGSKWDDVMKNISIIKSKGLHNLRVSARSTIQIDNILTYPEFLLCMILKDIDYAFSSHSFVVGPEYLCIQNLPVAIKKYIHIKFERFLEKHPIVEEKYGDYIEEILNFMDAEDMDEKIFKKYLVSTAMVDNFFKLKDGNNIIGLYKKLCLK